MILDPEQTRLFWWTARERQQVLLNRRAGLPRDQWTSDPVMRSHHFCNVFRCDDRVSQAVLALAHTWGDPWRAALVGRLINKYETLTAMRMTWGRPVTPGEFGLFAQGWGLNTNAYRLNTPRGLNNLEGLVVMYQAAQGMGSEILAQDSVPMVLVTMRQVKCLSGFIGYQMILDLLEMGTFGPDFVDEWAWPGPGAGRGAMRLLGRPVDQKWERRASGANRLEMKDPGIVHQVMEELHRTSDHPENWPREWRRWTIHEAEGWLCEYDKWARITNGEASGGRKYKGEYKP